MKHLGLKSITREFKADYGSLPDFSKVITTTCKSEMNNWKWCFVQTNPDHDILFTYNGTTSGVRVPNLDWISPDRKGLTFNDATSAAFAMNIGNHLNLRSNEATVLPHSMLS